MVNDSSSCDGSRTVTSSIHVNVGKYSTHPSKSHRFYLVAPRTEHVCDDVTLEDRQRPDKPTTGVTKLTSGADDDSNFVHLVHLPPVESGDGKPFDDVMTPVGFRETVALGGAERDSPRRSCASFCHYEIGQREKVELHLGAPKMRPVGYRELMVCYGPNSTRKRYRSTVDFRPKMVPDHFTDTCYVLPKRMSTSYVSYVDVGPDDHFRRKWYSSSVQVEPKTVSQAVVGGFRWLPPYLSDASSRNGAGWHRRSSFDESGSSSGICSEDEDDEDVVNWNQDTATGHYRLGTLPAAIDMIG